MRLGWSRRRPFFCGWRQDRCCRPAARSSAQVPWVKTEEEQRPKCGSWTAKGAWSSPDSIDSHTHPAFLLRRATADFAEAHWRRRAYEEIAAQRVAGIRFPALPRCAKLRQSATCREGPGRAGGDAENRALTTVEAKSGYGLTTEDEIKSLQAIRSAARSAFLPPARGTVVSTRSASPHMWCRRSFFRQTRRLCGQGLQ